MDFLLVCAYRGQEQGGSGFLFLGPKETTASFLHPSVEHHASKGLISRVDRSGSGSLGPPVEVRISWYQLLSVAYFSRGTHPPPKKWVKGPLLGDLDSDASSPRGRPNPPASEPE